jgi:hypothetical protein
MAARQDISNRAMTTKDAEQGKQLANLRQDLRKAETALDESERVVGQLQSKLAGCEVQKAKLAELNQDLDTRLKAAEKDTDALQESQRLVQLRYQEKCEELTAIDAILDRVNRAQRELDDRYTRTIWPLFDSNKELFGPEISQHKLSLLEAKPSAQHTHLVVWFDHLRTLYSALHHALEVRVSSSNCYRRRCVTRTTCEAAGLRPRRCSRRRRIV